MEEEKVIVTWYGEPVTIKDTDKMIEVIEHLKKTIIDQQKQHERDIDFLTSI